MKSVPLSQQHRASALAGSGVALVLVLSAIVLLSVLIIAFVSSVTTERAGAKTYSDNTEARKLADTALSVVVAQIKDATTGEDSAGKPTAWASQPGLIRTFDKSGTQVAAYKLYSSETLKGDKDFDPAKGDLPDSKWHNFPGLYTDLNAPVFVPDASGSTQINGRNYSPNYPILDPAALPGSNADSPKGFSVNGAPVENGVNANPIPMPVKWLYVLRNGEIVSATAGTGKAVTLSGSASATKDNPIVGRVAFWTDDETCKVNINTAAGDLWDNTSDPGSFCDTPMASNAFESTLKTNQPSQHEYQRYPGHPATTYLSAVFPSLLSSRTDIYDIIPRVTYTGSTQTLATTDVSSQGGTKSLYKNTGGNSSTAVPVYGSPVSPSDGDHLYGSVDELQFVVKSSQLSSSDRPSSLFTPARLQQAKFFLTAHSRAPDINLFGKPRIGMWPQIVGASDELVGTAYDKTIAFCTTIGSGSKAQRYFFTRRDSANPFYDYYGESSPSPNGVAMSRNRELYSYLQLLTGQDFPGFGGNFSSKYGVDRNQILTEIFDYIRSCINLVDSTATTSYAGKIAKDISGGRFNPAGTGHVAPIQITTGGDATMGFGRSQTLYSPIVTLVALDTGVYNADAASASYGNRLPPPSTPPPAVTSVSGNAAKKYKLITTKVQAVLLISSFSAAKGVVRGIPNLVYEVTGLDGLTLNGEDMGFPSAGAVNFDKFTPNNDYASGGVCGAGNLFFDSKNGKRKLGASTLTANGASDPGNYPFYSAPINLSGTVPGMPPTVVGAEVKTPLTLAMKSTKPIVLKVYARDSNGNVNTAYPVQTIELEFPTTTLPTPVRPGSFATSPSNTLKSTNPATEFDRNPDACMTNSSANSWAIFTDATRGLVPMASKIRGDLRLVAAKPYVDKSAFIPADGYYKKSAEQTITSTNKWAYNYGYGSSGWPAPSNRPDSMTDGMMAGADRPNAGGGWGGYAGNLVAGVTYNIHAGSSAQPVGGTASFYPDQEQNTSIRPQPMQMPNGDPLPNEALLETNSGNYRPGDWDNGIGADIDGPYINKADEGEIGTGAYYSWSSNMVIGTLFSPNRQVPSPVMFGSLSTGVKRVLPWQTLLFCPNPPAKDDHPGWGAPAGPDKTPPYTQPPDHLLLDLFTMPVVEPYAISEPFSTAGKINMNYQIAPFTYIKRSTGLQAVLRSARIAAIPTADGQRYHRPTAGQENPNPYRLNINIDATLEGFENRFAANQPFRAPSEICQMFLVPQGMNPATNNTIPTTLNVGDMPAWWDSFKLTGDNLREGPYSQIYSRLTTKSNSYTVHVRVQALKKVSSDPNQNQWVEGKDQILGEYRGAFTIERFIDPNDQEIPKAFDETYMGGDVRDADGSIQKTGRLDPFYRFRVVHTKQFAP